MNEFIQVLIVPCGIEIASHDGLGLMLVGLNRTMWN